MELFETNFARWANFWVGLAVLAALFIATSIALRFAFR
jgi:hypothetical protein